MNTVPHYSSHELFDCSIVFSIIKNNDVLKSLIDTWIDMIDSKIKLVEDEDVFSFPDTVANHIHSIKGASYQIGATLVGKKSELLEKLFRNKNLNQFITVFDELKYIVYLTKIEIISYYNKKLI
jgi:HPt (histidine-containing phosphotransfer) domain-containing protein